MADAMIEAVGCLVNSIFIGRGAPGEHESSVAKWLFRELGSLYVIEFLTSDFWILPKNRILRQNSHAPQEHHDL